MSAPSRIRFGTGVLVALCLVSGVFAAGSLGDAATPRDDRILIATFGAGMGVFGILLALSARHDRRAWSALWYLPVFLVLHVVLLGTVLPDGLFLVLALAGLWALRPSAAPARSVSVPAG